MSPQRHRDTKVWRLNETEHSISSCQTFVSLCLCGDILFNLRAKFSELPIKRLREAGSSYERTFDTCHRMAADPDRAVIAEANLYSSVPLQAPSLRGGV
jgi:hypothetical protein